MRHASLSDEKMMTRAVMYNLIPLGSVIIIPSGVRNVICQNKDPYQATSIVSVMVCEMHHGFGTLLNCYPGGVLAFLRGW